jgi:hypothetical protein
MSAVVQDLIHTSTHTCSATRMRTAEMEARVVEMECAHVRAMYMEQLAANVPVVAQDLRVKVHATCFETAPMAMAYATPGTIHACVILNSLASIVRSICGRVL